MKLSKYEMNMDEMEKRIARKIGTFEKLVYIDNLNGTLTEWCLVGNVWIAGMILVK